MNKYVILFDGICNFCNFWINLILRLDRRRIFVFSPLQSDSGQKYLKRFGLHQSDFDTFIVVKNNHYFNKSDAVFLIAEHLPLPYRLLKIFKILPKKLRDWLYSFIAKNRFRIFGKKETCRMPERDEIARFLK